MVHMCTQRGGFCHSIADTTMYAKCHVPQEYCCL
jgi:hypothetical protein